MSYRKKHYPQQSEKSVSTPTTFESEYSNPGTERSIHTGKLTSGLPYQRSVNPKEVDRLIQEWDERLLDPVIVSFRDGRFNVVDGQHRIAAMRKMNGGGNVMVNCKVYSGMTYSQEADFCYKLDKAKKRLSLSQSTNALAESGTDCDIADAKRIVERWGYVWALNRRGGRENEIVSTRATMNAYRLLGSSDFALLFALLRDTWKGHPCSLTSYMISGTALFLKTYAREMDDRTFVSHLSKVDPDEIVRRGKLDFSTSSNALRFARIILEKYNTGKGGKKLPYRLNG